METPAVHAALHLSRRPVPFAAHLLFTHADCQHTLRLTCSFYMQTIDTLAAHLLFTHADCKHPMLLTCYHEQTSGQRVSSESLTWQSAEEMQLLIFDALFLLTFHWSFCAPAGQPAIHAKADAMLSLPVRLAQLAWLPQQLLLPCVQPFRRGRQPAGS